jgi:dihydrofolate synthase / folylpolyglutamate synthase
MSPRESQPIRSLEEAARWLEGLIDVEKRPDWPYRRFSLEPAQRLLERLGRPDRGLRVLHVAGSKGKGSTALFAEAVLGAAGQRTGTFTSPHLERWTERFRIGGREVEGARLAAAVERVRPHLEALREQGVRATFFDATTAAGLELFRAERVECAILEVGLGGRLDSTNVVQPAVCCITSIELEHTDRLGTTRAAIAAEKAGIAKPGVPLLVGELAPEALEVVERRAAEVGAPLARLGREIRVEVRRQDLGGAMLRVRDGPLDAELEIAALGGPQPLNAALAVAASRRMLPDLAPSELARAAREGLPRASLPGRVEVMSRAPWVVVDSSHTAASAAALAGVLAQLEGRVRLVISISAGKDSESILAALLPHASDVTLTRAEPTRSLDPAEIARAVRARAPELPLRVVPNPHLAVRAAREGLARGEALCVAGSVYLAGIARRVLRDADASAPVAVTRRRDEGG